MARKLAPGSNLSVDDQLRLYEEAMGAEAAERQRMLADREAGRCTCEPSSVRRRWEGGDKLTSRRVHDTSCPRWMAWMREARA